MSADAGAGARGALSVDEAVAALDRRMRDHPSTDDSDNTGDSEGAGQASDEAGGWDEDPALGDDETEAEGDEEQGAVERLAPPKYWSKDAKARFAELGPDLQAVVLSQEGPREAAAAKAKAEAAQVKQAAESEMAGVHALAEQLHGWLPQALNTLNARWGANPDWVGYAERHGAEAMSVAKARYEAERGQLARVAQATAAAEARSHQAYVASEFQRLRDLDPELCDPKRGDELRAEVARYLQGRNVPPRALLKISALEMSIARKAMLWDQAQAKAANPRPAPRADAPATRPLARGGAAAGPVDPKARRAQAAKTRFAKSRSIEDAVALLNAQGD
jgi:hypothetical protein